MKVAVSIPDELFLEAEKVAQATSRTRSRLYSDALRLYLKQLADRQMTDALDQLAAEEDTSLDPAYASAVYRTLARSEW